MKSGEVENQKEVKSEVKVGCVIMASGVSKRFGENKLLAEFRGKSLIQTALELTEGDLFASRVVLTRTKEVEGICKNRQISVLYHNLPSRNNAIQLGVEDMQDMDGILFCPCDQPLLRRGSIKKLKEQFEKYIMEGNKSVILRLCFEEKPGTPVLFGKENFEELKQIPEGYGGSWLCRKYPERVKLVQAEDSLELYDIDTKEDLEYLKETICVNE